MEKIVTVFLASNPLATQQLTLDQEAREIMDRIRASKYRELLDFISIWAVRPRDLLDTLNTYSPEIVHFSGHGSPTGALVLVDRNGDLKNVSVEALREVFQTAGDSVKLVILNACYSLDQAEAISNVVGCSIGISGEIQDDAAVIFSAAFYGAIGSALSVKAAFEQGRVAILLEGLEGKDQIELYTRKGVNPAGIVLVEPSEYDYDKLGAMLRTNLKSNDRLVSFYQENFPGERNPAFLLDDPKFHLLMNIYLLIEQCHQDDELDRLVNLAVQDYRKTHSVRETRKFDLKRKKEKLAPTQLFSGLKAHLFGKPAERETELGDGEKSHIQLILDGDRSDMTMERLQAGMRALAGVLQVPVEEISMRGVRSGSIILDLDLPSPSVNKLITLYEEDPSLMHDLGITYVFEVLEEIYDLEHIHSLLTNAYSRDELIEICATNFPGLVGISTSDTDAIAKSIVEDALQTLRVGQLLDLVKSHKPAEYDKYGGYYRVPRRPGKNVRGRSTSDKVWNVDVSAAIWKCSLPAMFGSLLLLGATIGISLFNPTLAAVVWWLGLVPLGLFTGQGVSKKIPKELATNSGLIAVGAYYLGLMLAPFVIFVALVLLFLFLALLKQDFAVLTEGLPLIAGLYRAMVALVLLSASPFDVGLAPVGLGAGTFLAYRSAGR